jgi:hypothetical protein
MTDLIAAAAALVAAISLGLRAYMLRPKFCSWYDAPARVWAALLGLSSVLFATFLHLMRHGGASEREAVILVGMAAAAVALLANLAQQGRAAAVVDQVTSVPEPVAQAQRLPAPRQRALPAPPRALQSQAASRAG